jgi:hypothetical protein
MLLADVGGRMIPAMGRDRTQQSATERPAKSNVDSETLVIEGQAAS